MFDNYEKYNGLWLIEFNRLAGSTASATLIIFASEFDDINDGEYHNERITEKAADILEATAKDWRLDLKVTRDTTVCSRPIRGINDDGDGGSRFRKIEKNHTPDGTGWVSSEWETDAGNVEWTDLPIWGDNPPYTPRCLRHAKPL